MATFRCLRSGNTTIFTDENDIAGLRKHEGYTEVLDEIKLPEAEDAKEPPLPENAKAEVITLESIKKRGRPKK